MSIFVLTIRPPKLSDSPRSEHLVLTLGKATYRGWCWPIRRATSSVFSRAAEQRRRQAGGALDTRRWSTRIELSTAIFDWIEAFYNPTRRHSSLDMMSPNQFEGANQLTPSAA